MKKVCLVSPHFPPSNLVGVHRVRLIANHLKENGWEPTVLTVHPDYYEEKLDQNLSRLVRKDLKIVQVSALTQRVARPLGFGDIGFRSFLPLLYRLNELLEQQSFDLLVISIPSNYASLLGRALFSMKKIPYVIDYIDPWVHESNLGEKFLSKAWISQYLAANLEPLAVSRLSGISGISPGYFQSVIKRNPQLKDVPQHSFQIGFSMRDFDVVEQLQIRPSRSIQSFDHKTIVYAGALLPKAMRLMRCFLQAIDRVNRNSSSRTPYKMVCIGTGSSPDDCKGFRILPLAQEVGAEEWVLEYPERHAFLDVLATLQSSDVVSVIGSEEPHYSPSKLFQALASGKPTLAILHQESAAIHLLDKIGGAHYVAIRPEMACEEIVDRCVAALEILRIGSLEPVNSDALSAYDASQLCHDVSLFFDRCLDYFHLNYA